MDTFTNNLFSIDVPKGWQIKEHVLPIMPLAVTSDDSLSSQSPANFNVTLVDAENKSLIEVARENSERNCAKGACLVSKLAPVSVNAFNAYKAYQDIRIDNKEFIIQQYYIPSSGTIYLVSFFCRKQDWTRNQERFERVAASFRLREPD